MWWLAAFATCLLALMQPQRGSTKPTPSARASQPAPARLPRWELDAARAPLQVDSYSGPMVQTPDGKSAWFLCPKSATLRRLDLDKLELDPRTVPLEKGCCGFALAPDGKTIYVCASEEVTEPPTSKRWPEPKGTIQAVDTATLKVTATFAIKAAPFAIASGPKELLYLTQRRNTVEDEKAPIVVVDAKKKRIVGSVGERSLSDALIQIAPDARRLFTLRGGDQLVCYFLGAKADPVVFDAKGAAPGFVVSQDGKYLVILSRQGAVLNADITPGHKQKFKLLDQKYEASPLNCAAFDPATRTVWFADGYSGLLWCSLPDFKAFAVSPPVTGIELQFSRRTKCLIVVHKGRTADDSFSIGFIDVAPRLNTR